MTFSDLLQFIRNGETATQIASRAGTDCREVVPLLNEARTQGTLRRTTPDQNGRPCPVARWEFA